MIKPYGLPNSNDDYSGSSEITNVMYPTKFAEPVETSN